MPRFFVLFLFNLVSACALAEVDRAEALSAEEESRALASAQALGAEAFRHDRAASLASDALGKVRSFRRDRRVRGWITEAREGAVAVTILGGDSAQALALYRATVADDGQLIGEVQVLKQPEPLGEFERGAARARATAWASGFQPCGKNYNSVTLPGDGGNGQWIVYLFPGTTKRNVVPIGGSYRVNVDLQNDSWSIRAYTRSCIELPNEPHAVALMVTHLLDPVPTDAHVFWSLWAAKPIYLATTSNRALWKLEGGQIARVDREAAVEESQ